MDLFRNEAGKGGGADSSLWALPLPTLHQVYNVADETILPPGLSGLSGEETSLHSEWI